MEKCKICGSTEIEKNVVDLSSDNIVEIYTCKECQYHEYKTLNIVEGV